MSGSPCADAIRVGPSPQPLWMTYAQSASPGTTSWARASSVSVAFWVPERRLLPSTSSSRRALATSVSMRALCSCCSSQSRASCSRTCSRRSTMNETPAIGAPGAPSNVAPPTRTGTCAPSLATSAFSYGAHRPVARSSASARSSSSLYSGGVRALHETAPDSSSSRERPTSCRNASLAWSTRPSSRQKRIPITLASTSRRRRASLSFSARAVCACSVTSKARPIVPTMFSSRSRKGSARPWKSCASHVVSNTVDSPSSARRWGAIVGCPGSVVWR